MSSVSTVSSVSTEIETEIKSVKIEIEKTLNELLKEQRYDDAMIRQETENISHFFIEELNHLKRMFPQPPQPDSKKQPEQKSKTTEEQNKHTQSVLNHVKSYLNDIGNDNTFLVLKTDKALPEPTNTLDIIYYMSQFIQPVSSANQP